VVPRGSYGPVDFGGLQCMISQHGWDLQEKSNNF
jgi:hypothetical protein